VAGGGGRGGRWRWRPACRGSFALRNPLVFAYEWASLDVLSNGRTRLVVCAGGGAGPLWEAESAALNIAPGERRKRMIENINVLRHLWTKDDQPFAGQFTSFSNVTLEPKPLQSPCPIWLATNAERLSKGQADSGGSELALTRVGTIADGWMTHSVSPEGFQRSWDFILERGREHGRDMSAFDNVLYPPPQRQRGQAGGARRFQKVPRPLLFRRLHQSAAGGLADLWLAAGVRRAPQALQGGGLPAHHLSHLDHGRSDGAIPPPGRGRAAIRRLARGTPFGEACMQTLGLGFTWEQLPPGQRFRTLNRTIPETALVFFTAVTGMLETIFIDRTFAAEKGAIQGQFVPAVLTYSLIEGLLCQSMIQGTGLAMLELNKQVLAPVRVGDTVHGEIEITSVRPTSKGNHGIVVSRIDVKNQKDEVVMTYEATRMLAGRSSDQGTPQTA